MPCGPTAALANRLAREISAAGWPTWAIGDAGALEPSDRLEVGAIPQVDEPLAALAMALPLQRLAGRLAELRGRAPGVLLRGSKVTDVE